MHLASDGDKGLEMATADQYDVLVVDHDMPKKKGLEVIRTLAVQGSDAPTIMVTGAGDESVAVESMKMGATDYIVKDTKGRYLDLIPTVIDRALAKQHLLQEKEARRRSTPPKQGTIPSAGEQRSRGNSLLR